MAKILIDTGIFVALFDSKDNYHQKAVEFIKNNKKPLITSLACITETLFLLQNPLNRKGFLDWLYLARIEIAQLGYVDMPQLANLMSRYANVPMDFADACLVYLAERENLSYIATIDSDFHIYRINGYPFRIVVEYEKR